MFDAYPRQRISYSKVALPLSLVALLCLVLYAVFESGEEARPDSEDPNMKRMRPFLSSQSFEIGLWTRQKGSSASPSSASVRSSSPEVEELRQELEKARVRSEEQAAELSRLRGSMSAGSKEDLDDGDEAPTKTAPGSAAEIPESLWREPPSTSSTRAPQEETPKTEKEPKEPKEPEAVKDSTITVKTGDKEISIQIGKELSTSSTTLQMRGADQIGDGDSEVSTTQAKATSFRANATDAKIRGDGDGTLITVRSGQQSIVIQVREGEQVTTSSPTTTDITNTTLVIENPVKALPDVPELPPEPKAEEPVDVEGDKVETPVPKTESEEPVDVEGDKVETPVPKTESEASTTKGFSAYANLALRTR